MPEVVSDEMFDKARGDFAIQQDKLAYAKLEKELAKALLFETITSAVISSKKLKLIHQITNRIDMDRRYR